MKKRGRRQYSAEFKEDAVKLVLSGRSVGEAAEKDGLKVTHYGRFRFDPPRGVRGRLRSEAHKAERSSLHELEG